jgi:hypothetical protein
MVIRELIKSEIDKVEDEYLPALYRIVKALEPTAVSPTARQADWRAFLVETYGSTAAAPLERGEQGTPETREALE